MKGWDGANTLGPVMRLTAAGSLRAWPPALSMMQSELVPTCAPI